MKMARMSFTLYGPAPPIQPGCVRSTSTVVRAVFWLIQPQSSFWHQFQSVVFTTIAIDVPPPANAPVCTSNLRCGLPDKSRDDARSRPNHPPFCVSIRRLKSPWRSEEHTSELQSHHDLV